MHLTHVKRFIRTNKTTKQNENYYYLNITTMWNPFIYKYTSISCNFHTVVRMRIGKIRYSYSPAKYLYRFTSLTFLRSYSSWGDEIPNFHTLFRFKILRQCLWLFCVCNFESSNSEMWDPVSIGKRIRCICEPYI